MTPQLQVAIVGYGMGGIAAAIHLRRLGHHITHFDRNAPPSAEGAGMLLHPRALRQLGKLGVLEAALELGSPVRRICAQNSRGQVILDLAYADFVASQYGLGIQRGTLHRLLSGADAGRDLVLGSHTITSVDPHGGYLFQDPVKRHGPFDLIVIADGANSSLRDQMPVLARRNQRADTVALVGLLHDPDGFAKDRLAQYFDGTEHLSVWPVGSSYPGEPLRCSFAMNVSHASALAVLDQGHWRDSMSRLCPGVRRLLGDSPSTPRPYLFTYRDVDLGVHAAGRAVLIGDAAHSMSPQLGVGAQLAMEDAEVLANKLTKYSELKAALNAYSLTRRTQLTRYQHTSRWMTPLLQSDSRLLAGIRDRLLASAMRVPMARQLAHELLS